MKPPMHDPITLKTPKLIKDVHTVVSGDTLSSIAVKYNKSSTSIMAENNMSSSAIFVGQKLTIPNPHIVKDDRGFAVLEDLAVIARVIQESTLIIDDKGQERQATFTVIMPETVTPQLGDTVVINGESVTIIKRKPRKSYSGKKIFYWVTNCGT